jgi:thioesterase domain-containing protein
MRARGGRAASVAARYISRHAKAPAGRFSAEGLAVQGLGLVDAPEVRFSNAERSSHSAFQRAIALLQQQPKIWTFPQA